MATKTVAKEKKEVKKSAPEVKELSVYTKDGTVSGTFTLPEQIANTPWKADLVHQVVTALLANKRQNRAHTKDRSEVSGGGRKPWKQKGTGQARHGSSRSPIWRHGGTTFGPRNTRDYHEKINKKMRTEALFSILAKKAKEGEILAVEKMAFSAPKTKDGKQLVSALATGAKAPGLLKPKNAALIALSAYDANAVKSFRNMGNIATEEVRNLNPLMVLSAKYLVIEDPKAAFETLIGRKTSK